MTKGERIKALREKRGMSQVELAEHINVSKQTLYKYENDIVTNIPSDKIEAMAQVLNTTPAHIMGWNGESRFAGYYLNDDTARIAQEIFDDPRKRALFDASRKATPEALELVAKMLEELNK